MLKQAQWIKDFCDKEGFKFVETDKVPCSLDKKYKEDNHTIFIKGFEEGSKRITMSYGGLKNQMGLKKPISEWDIEAIRKHCIPDNFTCAKCGKKNLNLRTQDNHKTYDCPECQEVSADSSQH